MLFLCSKMNKTSRLQLVTNFSLRLSRQSEKSTKRDRLLEGFQLFYDDYVDQTKILEE